MIRAVEWNSGAIIAVDQTVLPAQLRRVYLTTLDEVVDAVQWSGALQSSGSPGRSGSRSPRGCIGATTTPCGATQKRYAGSRPTAVNLRCCGSRCGTRR